MYGKVPLIYGKVPLIYGKVPLIFGEKETLIFGKETLIFGKETLIFHKSPQSWDIYEKSTGILHLPSVCSPACWLARVEEHPQVLKTSRAGKAIDELRSRRASRRRVDVTFAPWRAYL